MKRPIGVAAMLSSMRTLPHPIRDNSRKWLLYNKVAALPFPVVRSGGGGAEVQLRAALKAGIVLVDPQGGGRRLPQQKGSAAGPNDVRADWCEGKDKRRCFHSEKDFLVFLIANNVSVCDLGAGSTALNHKRAVKERASFPCPRRIA